MAVKNGKVAPSSGSSHSDSLVDTLESGYQMRRQEHAENRLLVPQTVKWMCSKILPRLGTADEMEIYVEKANFKEGDLRSRLFRLGDVR